MLLYMLTFSLGEGGGSDGVEGDSPWPVAYPHSILI